MTECFAHKRAAAGCAALRPSTLVAVRMPFTRMTVSEKQQKYMDANITHPATTYH